MTEEYCNETDRLSDIYDTNFVSMFVVSCFRALCYRRRQDVLETANGGEVCHALEALFRVRRMFSSLWFKATQKDHCKTNLMAASSAIRLSSQAM